LPADIIKLYDAIQHQTTPEKQSGASKLYQLVMEWKVVKTGQIEAMFLWLATIYDIEQPPYPPPDRRTHITKLTQRFVDGHTRGILQVLPPSEEGKPAKVDFLQRLPTSGFKSQTIGSALLKKGLEIISLPLPSWQCW
jgi:hypothetical protein